MKAMNWVEVDESTPFEKLPAGGYVVRITDVEDVSSREYLNIVYDVAEGPHQGFFSDDFSRANPWKHRFVRSYKQTAQGMFRAFLARLEDTNPGFEVAAWQVRSNEQQFVGLLVGVVVQYELYTNDSGDDKERLNVVGVYSADDIRAGNYKLPEVKDSRTGAGADAFGDAAAYPGSAAGYAAAYAAHNPAPDAFGGQDEQPPVSAYGDLPFC